MELKAAERMAQDMLMDFELDGWTFKFDRATNRFGMCSYTRMVISLSAPLTKLNDEEDVRQVLLHEIAHALTPGAKHGPAWQRMARSIGYTGKRTHNNTTPPSRWLVVCPGCGKVAGKRDRRSNLNRACAECCRAHANGRYDERFKLEFRPNPEFGKILSTRA